MSSTRSWKIPTAEQVGRAVAMLGQPAQARYFFDQLKNPEWLQPLRERGFFRQPPKAVPHAVRTMMTHPPWPAGRYLVRMAGERPELVRDIILEAGQTNNVVVHEALVEAAVGMPPDIAATLVPTLKKQIETLDFPLPERLATLMVHLAQPHLQAVAFEIARFLLEPAVKDLAPVKVGDETFEVGPRIEARFEEHEYEEVLNTHIVRLVDVYGMAAVMMLADVLESVIARGRAREGGLDDLSQIWRPTIEEDERNVGSDPQTVLVSGLRTSVERLLRRRPELLGEIVAHLEGRPRGVFHRLALFVLDVFKELDETRPLIRERLGNRELFDAPWADHEYSKLLKQSFRELPDGTRAQILDWIEGGPDLEAFRRSHLAWTGQSPSPEEVETFRKLWQRDHLAVFAGDLEGAWRETYLQLVAQYGDRKEDGFSRTFVGPTSPISADELRAMAPGDIVELLRTWKAEKSHFAPTPEGLGRVLSEIVKEKAESFIQAAPALRGIDPTYIRAIFRGLGESLGSSGPRFSWREVLDLAEWVLRQPRAIVDRRVDRLEADPDWGWSRQAIASLLAAGLRRNAIPDEERMAVWAILEQLAEDPDPDIHEDGKTTDPYTHSINSVRGEVMHSVIEYALWVRRNLEQRSEATEVAASFASMREVAALLEKHLNVDIEPTRTIRSVYGRWFPWLALLDHQWAAHHVQAIFPEGETPLWRAAWNAYIVFSPPYNSVLPLLKTQYERAIEEIDREEQATDSGHDPDVRLAEHLMLYYLRGLIPIDDRLLTRFWAKAPIKLAARALEFVGQTLERDKDPIPDDVLRRATALWDQRYAAIAAAGDQRGEEAGAFGWWFAGDKFDRAWALEQLVRALKIARGLRVDFRVIDRLSEMARGNPRAVVEALGVFIDGEEPWKIHGWRDEIRSILTLALQSGDRGVTEEAQRIIHRLGARGYFDFRDLLG